MHKDILGHILFFSVEDNRFQWLTVCKEWYKVGTNLGIFEKKHANHDLSIFLKTLTMIPRPAFPCLFKIHFAGNSLSIHHDWRYTDDKYWCSEDATIVGTIIPECVTRIVHKKTRSVITAFLDEKQCQRMFQRILSKESGIIVVTSRWGPGSNYLAGYELLDELCSNGIIYISEGKSETEIIRFNIDNIFVHYLKNKEKYYQFIKKHKEIVENEIKEDTDKGKPQRSWCSIL